MTTRQEVLSRAAAEMGPEAEGIAEALLNAPGFDASFERLLQAGVRDAALFNPPISLIMDATIKVSVEVQYEDRDSASWVQCARRLFLHTLFWLTALRGPSESYRDVTLRLVEAGR